MDSIDDAVGTLESRICAGGPWLHLGGCNGRSRSHDTSLCSRHAASRSRLGGDGALVRSRRLRRGRSLVVQDRLKPVCSSLLSKIKV